MTLRPALRPGAVLLRRDALHLQIGTSPGFVLRDQPGLFSVIGLFDGIRDIGRIAQISATGIPEFSGDVVRIVRDLMAAGLVFDARSWDIPTSERLGSEARSASLRGLSSARVVERSRFRIALQSDPSCRDLATAVSEILRRSGFARLDHEDPHLRLMLSHGEPDRRRFESAMESGHDHMRIVLEEDRVRLGPLVRPGLTPCVNCHDLHRTDWDHAWPALMTQFGKPAALSSAPALSATATSAAATAIAAEAISHCEDGDVQTNGHCLVIGPHYLDRHLWPVSFHPLCSCTLLIAA